MKIDMDVSSEITKFITELKIKTKVFGGYDQEETFDAIQSLCLLYEKEIKELVCQKERIAGELEQTKQQVSRLEARLVVADQEKGDYRRKTELLSEAIQDIEKMKRIILQEFNKGAIEG